MNGHLPPIPATILRGLRSGDSSSIAALDAWLRAIDHRRFDDARIQEVLIFVWQCLRSDQGDDEDVRTSDWEHDLRKLLHRRFADSLERSIAKAHHVPIDPSLGVVEPHPSATDRRLVADFIETRILPRLGSLDQRERHLVLTSVINRLQGREQALNAAERKALSRIRTRLIADLDPGAMTA